MGCEFCKPAIDPSEQAAEQAIDSPGKRGANETVSSLTPTVPDGISAATIRKNKDFLSKVKLFQRLPRDQHDVLASVCIEEKFSKGYKLIKQGDEGDAFYVIMSGSVNVDVDGKKVATLTTGDYLGENALLRDEPRNASITAADDIAILKITRKKFQEMQLADKLEFKHRVAVAGGGGGSCVTFPPSVKTADDRACLMKALKSNKNLSDIVELDDAKCNSLIGKAWEEKVAAGRAVIEQGSDQADYFYIIKSGTFDVYVAKADEGQSADDAMRETAQQVGSIPTGGSFGELALIFYAPRAATVKAKGDAVVWVVDRDSFKNVFATAAKDKAKENVKYLNQIAFFSCLKTDEKVEVVVAMSDSNFTKNEVIYEQGDKPQNFYLLMEGEVAEIKDGKEVKKVKATLAKGEIFGESALTSSANRPSTIKVLSDSAKCLQMDRASFEMLLAPYADVKKRGADGGESFVGAAGRASQVALATATKKNEEKEKEKPRVKTKRSDLKVLGLLGCGGFGAVELVEHIQTKETFAIKSLSKGHVVKCRMQKSVLQEKTIQHMCNSTFIVRLYECFNEPQDLCFLLELALGGELYDTYCKKGFHGSVKHAHFYSAATLFAFEHLHEKKIVYRDLKPENLLLTDTGCCKMTDMGLAKIVVGKTNTTCGTPDYFAPEVIAGSGHSHAVDWWTLGILIFELIAGHPPFETANPAQTMKKIQNGIEKVNFPSKLRGNGQDLISGLLKKQPNDRLPMKKGWTDNVKVHPWYDKFDWEKMAKDKVDPPYKPVVKSKKDLKNFSANPADKPPQIPYKDDGTGWDKDFAT